MTTTYDKSEWNWWQDACEGKASSPYNDTPMTGYYAYRPSGKVDRPKAVIFWYSTKDGGLRCQIDGQDIKYGLDIWPSCAKNPIAAEVYQKVVAGGDWPAEIRVDTAKGSDSSMTVAARAGHNSGDNEDRFTEIVGNIAEWTDRAKKAIKKGVPDNKDEADTLADLATKLADLANEGDRERLVKSEPLHKAWQAENARWNVHLKPVPPLVSNLKALGFEFIKKERKRLADEAAAAEKEREEQNPGTLASPPPPPARMDNPLGIGTRKTVYTVKRDVVAFSDFAAAAAFFCTQEHPALEIVEAIKRATHNALKAGIAVPGAKFETQESAR